MKTTRLPVLLIAALTLGTLYGCDRTTEQEPETGADSHRSPATLDAVIADYVEAERDKRSEDRVASVNPEAARAETEDMRDMLQRLRSVDAEALATPERIDLQLLTGLLEASIYDATHFRGWKRDPSLYLPANRIASLLDPASDRDPAERARLLTELLKRMPERYALAKRNLAEPPRRFTEEAIYQAEATLETLNKDGATLVNATDTGSETLQTALADAKQALTGFKAFLEEDVLPRSVEAAWAIGPEHYNYILKHRWHMDATAGEILARGKKAFAETEAEAQQVSERIDPGRHWSEVYEDLKDEHPPADGIKAAYQKSIDAAREFVIEHDIVTLPEGEKVITVDTPPAMRRSSPFGTFDSVDPFGDSLTGRLVLTPIPDDIPEEQRMQRLRSHHDAWIPIIAVHEAYPGHHVDALKTRENPRPLRRMVHEPIFSEGWGLFTEQLMYEQGFLQGDDVRLTQLRNRLWRAARVILDSSLHTGKITFEEAVDFLVEKVRFERHAAELEVGMYIRRPTYVLGYLIGMQEINNIRRDYIEEFGEPSPPSEFYDLLLTAGAMPPNLVREAVFHAARERRKQGK